jgi:hypothetical protein
MADPIKVDSHVHLYRTSEQALEDKEIYEIFEYGTSADVHWSALTGTIEETLEAMAGADIAAAIVVNLYAAAWERLRFANHLPKDLNDAEREKAMANFEGRIPDELMAFNRWGCQIARDHGQITTLVCADLQIMSADETQAHVRDMVENEGAGGVKLHGPAHGFGMWDERLWPTYEACRDLGVPVIAHSGPDPGGNGFAEPRAFAEALKAFPDLTIVLAHMGGGTWQQAAEIAEQFPNAFFDCCEIIEWTSGDLAPSDEQLAQLIKDVGPHRVMMGSDFPWYDLDHTVDRVMELPLLSREEKEGIMGANAVRILDMTITN